MYRHDARKICGPHCRRQAYDGDGLAQKALLTEDAPPESKIRDSSKPSCSLYRLMRWSVLSQSDRVVRGDGENPKM